MIHFVGAGPGAPDLITLRGAELLKSADVIVYAGSLVNPAILEYAKPDCVIHDSSRMTLSEVISVLCTAERAGQRAVRLHTGDPSLYGAIREQMDLLCADNIPFKVCPGVSSFSGAASALKAEYTLPGVSQTVIITRMAGRTPVPEWENIAALAAHNATMIIFLSAGMLVDLQRELMAGGYLADTPAAIVYKATWPDEQVHRCPLANLAETAAKYDIANLALIAVGGFLGDDYQLSKLYEPAFSTAFRNGSEI